MIAKMVLIVLVALGLLGAVVSNRVTVYNGGVAEGREASALVSEPNALSSPLIDMSPLGGMGMSPLLQY